MRRRCVQPARRPARLSGRLSLLFSSRAPLHLSTFGSGKRIPRAAALSPSSGIFLRIPTSWLRSLWGFPPNRPRVLASSSALGLPSRRPGIHGLQKRCRPYPSFGEAKVSCRVVSRPPADPSNLVLRNLRRTTQVFKKKKNLTESVRATGRLLSGAEGCGNRWVIFTR